MEEAFEYVERSKSRAFLNLLASSELETTIPITKDLALLLEEEHKHLSRLNMIRMSHLRTSNSTLEVGVLDSLKKDLESDCKIPADFL